MRSIPRLMLSLALFATSSASAQTLPGGSIHLAWDDCYGGGGAANKAFACDTNVGQPFSLYASVVPPPGVTQYVGHLAVFDLRWSSAQLPNWWRIGSTTPPSCRVASSLSAVPAAGATTCLDVTGHPQFGGIDYNFTNSPGDARLRTAYAMETHLAGPLASTQELTVLAITIDRRRTTGTGSCAGCAEPVCIEFVSLLLDQVDLNLPQARVTTGEQRFVTWNGPAPFTSCPASTPVQPRTWGQVKSLYR